MIEAINPLTELEYFIDNTSSKTNPLPVLIPRLLDIHSPIEESPMKREKSAAIDNEFDILEIEEVKSEENDGLLSGERD